MKLLTDNPANWDPFVVPVDAETTRKTPDVYAPFQVGADRTANLYGKLSPGAAVAQSGARGILRAALAFIRNGHPVDGEFRVVPRYGLYCFELDPTDGPKIVEDYPFIVRTNDGRGAWVWSHYSLLDQPAHAGIIRNGRTVALAQTIQASPRGTLTSFSGNMDTWQGPTMGTAVACLAGDTIIVDAAYEVRATLTIAGAKASHCLMASNGTDRFIIPGSYRTFTQSLIGRVDGHTTPTDPLAGMRAATWPQYFPVVHAAWPVPSSGTWTVGIYIQIVPDNFQVISLNKPASIVLEVVR